MSDDIERLRQLSEEANPGPWTTQDAATIYSPNAKEIIIKTVSDTVSIGRIGNKEDSEFVVELVNHFRATGNVARSSIIEKTVSELLSQRATLVEALVKCTDVSYTKEYFQQEIANIDQQVRGILSDYKERK